MAAFFELAEKRESCRNYDDTKRPAKEQLMKCIEAARLAPSAVNSQPWSFAVVNSETLSPKIAKHTQSMGLNKFTDKCPSFIVVFEEDAKLLSKVVGLVKDQKFAQMDIGIAVTHICYAALEQGLSTCIMGSFDEKKILEELNMPKSKRIRLVIAVGYAASDSLRAKKRKSIEDICTYFD